jgi:hypothetical protein
MENINFWREVYYSGLLIMLILTSLVMGHHFLWASAGIPKAKSWILSEKL